MGFFLAKFRKRPTFWKPFQDLLFRGKQLRPKKRSIHL
jgi:hypothetical protein